MRVARPVAGTLHGAAVRPAFPGKTAAHTWARARRACSPRLCSRVPSVAAGHASVVPPVLLPKLVFRCRETLAED